MKCKKITVLNMHLCYLPENLISEFKEVTPDITLNSWIKRNIKKQFNITIKSIDDIKDLQNECNKLFYKDVGEWIGELLRNHIKECYLSDNDGFKYYCYRVNEYGQVLYMVKDIYNDDIREMIPTWSINYNERKVITFNSKYLAKSFIENYFSPRLKIIIEKQDKTPGSY